MTKEPLARNHRATGTFGRRLEVCPTLPNFERGRISAGEMEEKWMDESGPSLEVASGALPQNQILSSFLCLLLVGGAQIDLRRGGAGLCLPSPPANSPGLRVAV